MSARARLTWYGDPQAVGPQDLLVYVAGQAGSSWPLAWLREARARSGQTPILAVTRGDPAEDAAQFGAAGAAQTIDWSIGNEAIIATALRMAEHGSVGRPPTPESQRVEIDTGLRTIRIASTLARVTTTELLIFDYLVRHADTWKTAADVLRDVLGNHHCPQTPVVRVHMFRLRRALGEMAYCIESHQGKGYRFTLRRETLPPEVV